MNFKEIQIPVPWGFIAGKSWGDESDEPIIALHGYQDNANTFDTIIPLLPKSFNYLCLDLPSHGKSSHMATQGLPSTMDFVLALKLITDHLNRATITIIGHSFGAQISVFFAQLFPECVKKLICLDAIYFLPIDSQYLMPEIREIFTRFSRLHKLDIDTAPTYTLEEAVQKLIDSRFVPISEEATRRLIPRSLTPTSRDKFKLTTAQHLKYVVRAPFSKSYQLDLMKNYPIQCPHLFIGASESVIYQKLNQELLEQMKKNPRFEVHVVTGTHDVHLERPERVAPILTAFLLKTFNKL